MRYNEWKQLIEKIETIKTLAKMLSNYAEHNIDDDFHKNVELSSKLLTQEINKLSQDLRQIDPI